MKGIYLTLEGKQITNKTILKQGDKTFQPIEVDGVIYWIDKEATECKFYLHKSFSGNDQIYNVEEDGGSLDDFKRGQPIGWCSKIVAQSQPKFEGIPIVSLDSYVEKFKKEYNSGNNSDVFTKGIETGIEIGYKSNPNQYTQKDIYFAINLAKHPLNYSNEQIFHQINSISVIEVDEQFNIISYE
jgi:hypothetical protein